MKKRMWLSLSIVIVISAVCVLISMQWLETAVHAYKEYEISEIGKEKDASTYTLHR